MVAVLSVRIMYCLQLVGKLSVPTIRRPGGQALKTLCYIHFWSWENSLFPLLALWGNKIWPPSTDSWTLLDTKIPFRMESPIALMVDIDIFPDCAQETENDAH